MNHIMQIMGNEIEGFWFECSCGVEGKLYDEKVPAEMEGATHELAEIL